MRFWAVHKGLIQLQISWSAQSSTPSYVWRILQTLNQFNMPEAPDHFCDRENLSEADQRVRELNDQFRLTFIGGRILLTRGVQALPAEVANKVIQAIQAFDDFDGDNDPYGTHEFGSVEVDGQKVWFKIDAYDHNLEYGSPDPSDPVVTKRVMTILLPSEY